MNAHVFSILTRAPEETERLGDRVARLLKTGGTVALRGELASGKTCFVRGMAHSFVDDSAVHSPTFTLINEYGRDPTLYHMDLYRLGCQEVAELGCEELFDGEALCVVEWADRAESLLPSRRLDIHFEHAGDDRRKLTFHDRGLMPPDWQAVLAAEGNPGTSKV